MTEAGDDRERFVRCPTCGQPARYAAGNPWRPFCCERCRGVDLGAWASEAYRVSAAGSDDDAADPMDGPAANQPPERPH